MNTGYAIFFFNILLTVNFQNSHNDEQISLDEINHEEQLITKVYKLKKIHKIHKIQVSGLFDEVSHETFYTFDFQVKRNQSTGMF